MSTPKHDEIGAMISLAEAGKGHSHWLKEKHGHLEPGDHDVIAVSFGKKKLMELLNKEGSMGIRFYFVKSINEINGKKIAHDDIVGIAFDEQGKDIHADKTDNIKKHRTESSSPLDHTVSLANRLAAAPGEAEVLNTSSPCPKFCNG